MQGAGADVSRPVKKLFNHPSERLEGPHSVAERLPRTKGLGAVKERTLREQGLGSGGEVGGEALEFPV